MIPETTLRTLRRQAIELGKEPLGYVVSRPIWNELRAGFESRATFKVAEADRKEFAEFMGMKIAMDEGLGDTTIVEIFTPEEWRARVAQIRNSQP